MHACTYTLPLPLIYIQRIKLTLATWTVLAGSVSLKPFNRTDRNDVAVGMNWVTLSDRTVQPRCHPCCSIFSSSLSSSSNTHFFLGLTKKDVSAVRHVLCLILFIYIYINSRRSSNFAPHKHSKFELSRCCPQHAVKQWLQMQIDKSRRCFLLVRWPEEVIFAILCFLRYVLCWISFPHVPGLWSAALKVFVSLWCFQ